jgi:hypothetical protein
MLSFVYVMGTDDAIDAVRFKMLGIVIWKNFFS